MSLLSISFQLNLIGIYPITKIQLILMIKSFMIVIKKEKRAETRKIEGNIGLGVKIKEKIKNKFYKTWIS